MMKTRLTQLSGWGFVVLLFTGLFAEAGSVEVPNRLLYPLLEKEISAQVTALGGCSVSRNGQADMVFFNPAGLWQRPGGKWYYWEFQSNTLKSTTNYIHDDVGLALMCGVTPISWLAVSGGLGIRGYKVAVPHYEIGDYNSPVKLNNVNFDDQDLVLGGAVTLGSDESQIVSLGLSTHYLSSDYGGRQAMGSIIDLGLQWQLSPQRDKFLLLAGCGLVYTHYFSRKWHHPKYLDSSENNTFKIGYHMGANIMWFPVFYSQFQFDINDAMEFNYREAGLGLQLRPLSTDEYSRWGFFELLLRTGFQTKRWQVSEYLGGGNSGLTQSWRVGLGINTALRIFQMSVDFSYVLSEWGGNYVPDFRSKLYGDRWMISLALCSRKISKAEDTLAD